LVLCSFTYGFPQAVPQGRGFFNFASKFLNAETIDKMKNLTSSMQEAVSAAAAVGAVVAKDVGAQMKEKANSKMKQVLGDEAVQKMKDKAMAMADKADTYLEAGKLAMEVMKKKVKEDGEGEGKEEDKEEDKDKDKEKEE